MPLAYYSARADEEFWSEHWGQHSVDELLAVAKRSPLTRLIVDALPPRDRGPVLEAGSGLGQYVILLRERGWRVLGADGSAQALATCRRAAPVPLMRAELGRLPVPDAALAAYVSLGVVEHDPDGPDRIVAEAARVLMPGGVVVLSVPYWNGVRRVGAPWVRRQNRALARRGGRFYQFAFSRREVAGILARHGFAVTAMHPYDPARLLRRWATRRMRAALTSSPSAPSARGDGAAGRDPSGVRGMVRSALYAGPVLKVLAHMILAIGVKR
jgi:SAM-dependent methyltransferase